VQIYRLLHVYRRRLRVDRGLLLQIYRYTGFCTFTEDDYALTEDDYALTEDDYALTEDDYALTEDPMHVNRGLLLQIYRYTGFCKWLLEICLTSKNTVSTIINRISPIPKWIVTRSACNFSTMTIAPRVICPNTNAAAIIDAIFVDLEVSFDLKVKNMVTNTMMPVVAATVLWKYSIKNSFIGIRPAGHSGH
jgi:hypothetical protein